MRKLLAVIITLLMVLYPFFVVWALAREQFFWVAALLVAMGCVRFFVHSNRLFLPLTLLALLCGSLSIILQNTFWLKFYPVLMSLGSCLIFAWTLYSPPTMIERFARLHQPELPESGIIWTRKVTKVWCVFLMLNALIALATIFASDRVWAIYNGLISYILMGGLLLGEFLLRKKHQAITS